MELQFEDPKFSSWNDFSVKVNEGIRIIEHYSDADENGSVQIILDGTVSSDCEVEPDPTPTPDPDPTPVPDPTPAPLETPVVIPKTGIETPQSPGMIHCIGLLGVCMMGAVIFAERRK
jgi:hypothetical protein